MNAHQIIIDKLKVKLDRAIKRRDAQAIITISNQIVTVINAPAGATHPLGNA